MQMEGCQRKWCDQTDKQQAGLLLFVSVQGAVPLAAPTRLGRLAKHTTLFHPCYTTLRSEYMQHHLHHPTASKCALRWRLPCPAPARTRPGPT
jgi:hypothetical protein